MKSLFFIIFASLMASSYTGNSQIITTIAGTGVAGYNGDGILASSAQLMGPVNIVLDKFGNIYIADLYNYRVRKISLSGVITTVAGNGTMGYSGDGGAATLAQITPADVVVDSLGDIFIADYENNAIRKVNSFGIISTIAGRGPTYYGFGGDGGMATLATLYLPSGIALDRLGNIYVADNVNYRIRKINSLGIISTIAGNGTMGSGGDNGPATNAEFIDPIGVSVDNHGNIFVADFISVRKIDALGIITTIAGRYPGGYGGDGGLATAALLTNVYRVISDDLGNIYIADKGNQRIRKVGSSNVITTIAGSDSMGYNGDGKAATASWFHFPTGVALDTSGNILISDCSNNRIRKLNFHFAPIIGEDSICTTNNTPMIDSTPGGAWTSSDPSIASVDRATGVVTGISNGSATISYTIGGTSATAPIVVAHLSICALGAKEVIGQGNEIILAPNPAQNILNITNAAGAAFAVYDLTGREVLSQKIITNQQIIDISGIEIGVYMIVVTDTQTGEKVVRRVVKE